MNSFLKLVLLLAYFNNRTDRHTLCVSDYNECNVDNGGCEHTCYNTEGSYTCSCNDGYILGTDNHMCVGKM